MSNLPKAIEWHIQRYPKAFATPRGLEYINAAGRQELLVAMRGLENHPALVISAPDPVAVVPVVEEVKEIVAPAPKKERKGKAKPVETPDQSTEPKETTEQETEEGSQEG